MVRISNLKILQLLKENARISYTKLAKLFDVSETAIRKRIRSLEAKGIIKKYTVELDIKKAGLVHALIGLDTRPEYYLAVTEKLSRLKEITSLYASSGDHMLLAECWFEKSTELLNFIKSLKKIKGVTKVCPAITLEKIK
ncbi:MAG: Lrp/AsnC family transcriptional regulator [Candidatus Pacearchaeota archaeon]